jgi:HEPN superfamily Apea-like protein/ApeA-like protein
LIVRVFFGDAERPTERFSGHLRTDRGKIELTSAPAPAGAEMLAAILGTHHSPAPPAVIHGTTMRGACTLLGLTALSGENFLGATGEGFTSQKLCADACVMGLHLPNETSPALTSATLTYAGIEGWVKAQRVIAFNEESTSLTYFKAVPIIDLCLVSDKTHLLVESSYRVTVRTKGRDTARSELDFTLEPHSHQTFEWLIDAAVRFENFLCACVGNSVRLKTARFTADRGAGWVVRPRSGKAGKPHPQNWIRCNSSQLAAALTSWFGSSRHLAPFENLIYGTIRRTSLAVETEFLSLAQAVESFHRLTGSSSLIETHKFANIRQSMADAIDACCTGPIATRLKEAINFANEPSFRNPIDELMARLPPALVDKLLGDPREFGQTLRQTRNYPTHPGTKTGSKVVVDAADLFLMNQKLHARECPELRGK